MTNYKFLQKWVNLQNGIMYDRLLDLGFARLGYCQRDASPFWNLALVNRVLTGSQLVEIETKLQDLGRKPAIYFEGRNDLTALVNLLEKTRYKKINEDSWMFFKNKDVDQAKFESVKKVVSEDELQTFLKIFNACYKENDPQNPYGELGDYLVVAESAWLKYGGIGELNYYLVYKGDEPVAVATLTNRFGLGYISNVGSLQSVRGQGYGKAATLFCVQESKKLGNKSHCLATEEGTYPNKFYQRIGFETEFTAPLLVKRDL